MMRDQQSSPSILISFMRLDAPLWMLTADWRQSWVLAMSRTSSVLALPSTGADLSLASQVPSS